MDIKTVLKDTWPCDHTDDQLTGNVDKRGIERRILTEHERYP
jgi:hypothetical protein